MAKILFAWELGGGLGHIGPFAPIARQLLCQKHEVCLAVRDISRVGKLYSGLDVTLFQAPTKTHRTTDRVC
ncbi:MAG: hypothetical protein MI861_02960, partial [Pirellulales bacterium]|nr:hypothetical protein [Pirellulales bacterium]